MTVMIRALVLGGAACVYDDARWAQRYADAAGVQFDLIVACNEIGIHWPRITDWVTLHPEKFFLWQSKRSAAGLNDDYTAVAPTRPHISNPPRVNVTMSDWGGSSGLFAIKRAYELNADRILVCGVPMTPTPHFNNERNWGHVDSFRNAWSRWRKHYGPRTRSMSGWTETLLGTPDPDWLIGA